MWSSRFGSEAAWVSPAADLLEATLERDRGSASALMASSVRPSTTAICEGSRAESEGAGDQGLRGCRGFKRIGSKPPRRTCGYGTACWRLALRHRCLEQPNQKCFHPLDASPNLHKERLFCDIQPSSRHRSERGRSECGPSCYFVSLRR